MAEKIQLSIGIENAKGVERALDQRRALVETNMRRAMMWAQADLHKNLDQRVPKVTRTLQRSWSIRGPKPIAGYGAIIGYEGGVGSNLVYAPIVEFGFDGTVKAHTRRSAFGRPTRPYTVPAHHRKQRPRPYAIPAFRASEDTIRQRHNDALNAAVEGRSY